MSHHHRLLRRRAVAPAFFFAAAAVCIPTPPALGGVVSVDPSHFGSGATIDTLENIVNVILPFSGGFPRSRVPQGFALPISHAVLTFEGDPSECEIMDFDAPGYVSPGLIGYGLGLEGGSIRPRPGTTSGGPGPFTPTVLPSYDSFLGVPAGNIDLTFPSPVESVGGYFEATIFNQIGYNGAVTLIAFDSTNQVLGELTIITDAVAMDHALDSWIGLATDDGSPSIAKVRILGPLSTSGTRGIFVMDNLTVQVPEPSGAGAAFLVSAAMVGVVRRRRVSA